MTGYTVRRYEQLRDISRDDRARIATCSLRTLTDRLKGQHRSGFGQCWLKDIELFTLCRQMIKLAFYKHFNSAIKYFMCQNVSFVACPIVQK